MIEFYFQNGDFSSSIGNWWSDLLITLIGTLVGSGVTIWVLYKTFQHDKKKEEFKKSNFSKEKVLYLKSLLDSIVVNIGHQIEYYKDFTKEIEKNNLNIPLLKQPIINDLNRLLFEMNLEEYYHSYLLYFGNKTDIIKEFRRIITILDFFDGILKNNKKSHEKSMEASYNRKIKYQQLLESFLDKIAHISINKELVTKHPELTTLLNDSLKDYHTKKPEPTPLEYAQENFVEKLKLDLLKLPTEITEVEMLLIELKNATIIYHDNIFQNQYTLIEFKRITEKIEPHYEDLKTLTKRILESEVEIKASR